MSFRKQYITDEQQLADTPLAKRRHFYLAKPLLATRLRPACDDEPLVGEAEITAAGLGLAPFWDDASDAIDAEGEAFNRYRVKHPGFGVHLRSGVVAKLAQAQASLPANLQIVVKAGLRPLSVQQELFDGELTTIKQEHPELTEAAAYAFAAEYVSDPARSVPPHSTGAAVDIVVVDRRSGQLLDVGSDVNTAGDESWCDNHTGLSEVEIANRELIIITMLGAGFANLASEWWHYSYGDQRWATFYNQANPLYGTVDL